MAEPTPEILAIRQHLVAHLGPPMDVISISGNPNSDSNLDVIEIAVFAPGGPDQPIVYATCGISAAVMSDGRRVEGLVVVRGIKNEDRVRAIYQMLGSFGLFVEGNPEPTGAGDIVRSKDEVGAFSTMDALLFLPPTPFVETFHAVDLPSGARVELIWLLPTYEAETEYAMAHGPQALLTLFAAQGLDLTQMDRDEANTFIDPDDAVGLAELREKEDTARANAPRTHVPQKAVDIDALAAFQADDGMTITRRVKDKPKPAPAPVAPPPPPEPQPEMAAPPPPRRPPPRRKKKRRPPRRKVRKFDLQRDGVGMPAQEARAPEPEPKAPAEPQETPEEAKRRKIAALKAQARARAERAKGESSGE